jgi:hypothetical protein
MGFLRPNTERTRRDRRHSEAITEQLGVANIIEDTKTCRGALEGPHEKNVWKQAVQDNNKLRA